MLGHCPMCNEKIPEERQLGLMIVCKCGWSISARADQVEKKELNRSCITIVILGLLMIGSFIHAINWNEHSFAIIPLKTVHVLGFASKEDLRKIANICEQRAKPSCTAEAYQDLYRKDSSEIQALAQVGKIHSQLGLFEESKEAFAEYFKLGGKDHLAAYEYAKVLGELGQVREATRYFEYVLKAKPAVLQVTVTKAYVDMLMRNKKLKEASRVIHHARRMGDNTGYFLERELQEIKKQLGVKS